MKQMISLFLKVSTSWVTWNERRRLQRE